MVDPGSAQRPRCGGNTRCAVAGVTVALRSIHRALLTELRGPDRLSGAHLSALISTWIRWAPTATPPSRITNPVDHLRSRPLGDHELRLTGPLAICSEGLYSNPRRTLSKPDEVDPNAAPPQVPVHHLQGIFFQEFHVGCAVPLLDIGGFEPVPLRRGEEQLLATDRSVVPPRSNASSGVWRDWATSHS